MDITIIAPMTQEQARNCITHLRYHLTHAEAHESAARTYARDLHDREGWRPLGYKSLQDCFKAELSVSWQHGYRLIQAAEVDENLSFAQGESVSIPDRHARELAKAPALLQAPAYARAQQAAEAEGVPLAGRHVEMAVKQALAEDSIKANPVIARAVAAGEITPSAGVLIKRELDSLPGQLQANVMSIMTEHGMFDPKLVVPVANMSARPDSKIYAVLRQTGRLGGVPLAEASFGDWMRERDEAREEHIAESQEDQRRKLMEAGEPVPEPVIITVYRGDAQKSVKSLVQALGTEDLKVIAERLMEHVIAKLEQTQSALAEE